MQVCDLYQRFPDYCIDVTTEQARLADASLVVLMHPIQWYFPCKSCGSTKTDSGRAGP